MLQYLQRTGKAIMLNSSVIFAGILLGVGDLINIAALENAPAIYQPLIAFIIPMITIILNNARYRDIVFEMVLFARYCK